MKMKIETVQIGDFAPHKIGENEIGGDTNLNRIPLSTHECRSTDTSHSFKNTKSLLSNSSVEDKDRIFQAWVQALQRAFENTDGLQPFEIVFRSLETSPAATFLQGDDSSGTMEALREAVRRAAEDITIRELSAELEQKYNVTDDLCSLRDAIHVPDIIHSTVMRVASEVEDTRSLSAGLAEISDKWKPATVKICGVSLVHEKHPYMHLDRAECEIRSFSLPFRETFC